MKVTFFTDDGRRLNGDGGAEFPDQAAAEQKALISLVEWMRQHGAQALPHQVAVMGNDERDRPLFRITLTTTIDCFDGDHAANAEV